MRILYKQLQSEKKKKKKNPKKPLSVYLGKEARGKRQLNTACFSATDQLTQHTGHLNTLRGLAFEYLDIPVFTKLPKLQNVVSKNITLVLQ